SSSIEFDPNNKRFVAWSVPRITGQVPIPKVIPEFSKQSIINVLGMPSPLSLLLLPAANFRLCCADDRNHASCICVPVTLPNFGLSPPGSQTVATSLTT